MKACDLADKKKLRDYFLNRLDPDETAQLQYHLSQCYACRQELERMRTLVDGLGQEDENEASRGMPVDSLWALRMKPVLRVAAMVAVVVLIAFGGYYFGANRTPDIPVGTNHPPVYQSGDAVIDTCEQDSIPKEETDSARFIRRIKELEWQIRKKQWLKEGGLR